MLDEQDTLLKKPSLTTDSIICNYKLQIMKKLFTLLAFIALCVTTSAQNGNGDSPLNMLQSSVVPGDVNGDGECNPRDHRDIIDYILDESPDDFIFENADMNNDNEISVTDVKMIVDKILHNSSTNYNNNSGNVYFSVDEVDVMQGGRSKVTVYYDSEGDNLKGFQLEFYLPNGFEVMSAKLGAELQANNPEMNIRFTSRRERDEMCVFLASQIDLTPMPEGEGIELFSFYINAKADCELGAYPVETTRIEFASDEKILLSSKEITFNVIPYAPRELEDTNTDLPEETGFSEDVVVKRHVSADVWSTLCLPFKMSYDQLKEIFGEDMLLAEFKSTEISEENSNILIVNFETTDDDLEANHPYVIYSKNELEGFTVQDVYVSPYEEDAHVYVESDGYFHRTLKADYYFSENGLPLVYIKNNKFYYNDESITMKAFRGYFEFYDFEPSPQANALFLVDGELTSIDGVVINGHEMRSGDVYSVSGMYMGRAENVMNSLPHGVYVINNKKVVVK